MEEKDYYVAYFDGACEPTNPKGNMGIGAFILNPKRETIFEYSKYVKAEELNYETSNNVAEYLAFIEVVKFFKHGINNGEKKIICGDSKLVINQMNNEWGCKGGIYMKYYHQAIKYTEGLFNVKYVWIPREKNIRADELSKGCMVKNGCEFRIQKY